MAFHQRRGYDDGEIGAVEDDIIDEDQVEDLLADGDGEVDAEPSASPAATGADDADAGAAAAADDDDDIDADAEVSTVAAGSSGASAWLTTFSLTSGMSNEAAAAFKEASRRHKLEAVHIARKAFRHPVAARTLNLHFDRAQSIVEVDVKGLSWPPMTVDARAVLKPTRSVRIELGRSIHRSNEIGVATARLMAANVLAGRRREATKLQRDYVQMHDWKPVAASNNNNDDVTDAAGAGSGGGGDSTAALRASLPPLQLPPVPLPQVSLDRLANATSAGLERLLQTSATSILALEALAHDLGLEAVQFTVTPGSSTTTASSADDNDAARALTIEAKCLTVKPTFSPLRDRDGQWPVYTDAHCLDAIHGLRKAMDFMERALQKQSDRIFEQGLFHDLTREARLPSNASCVRRVHVCHVERPPRVFLDEQGSTAAAANFHRGDKKKTKTIGGVKRQTSAAEDPAQEVWAVHLQIQLVGVARSVEACFQDPQFDVAGSARATALYELKNMTDEDFEQTRHRLTDRKRVFRAATHREAVLAAANFATDLIRNGESDRNSFLSSVDGTAALPTTRICGRRSGPEDVLWRFDEAVYSLGGEGCTWDAELELTAASANQRATPEPAATIASGAHAEELAMKPLRLAPAGVQCAIRRSDNGAVVAAAVGSSGPEAVVAAAGAALRELLLHCRGDGCRALATAALRWLGDGSAAGGVPDVAGSLTLMTGGGGGRPFAGSYLVPGMSRIAGTRPTALYSMPLSDRRGLQRVAAQLVRAARKPRDELRCVSEPAGEAGTTAQGSDGRASRDRRVIRRKLLVSPKTGGAPAPPSPTAKAAEAHKAAATRVDSPPAASSQPLPLAGYLAHLRRVTAYASQHALTATAHDPGDGGPTPASAVRIGRFADTFAAHYDARWGVVDVEAGASGQLYVRHALDAFATAATSVTIDASLSRAAAVDEASVDVTARFIAGLLPEDASVAQAQAASNSKAPKMRSANLVHLVRLLSYACFAPLMTTQWLLAHIASARPLCEALADPSRHGIVAVSSSGSHHAGGSSSSSSSAKGGLVGLPGWIGLGQRSPQSTYLRAISTALGLIPADQAVPSTPPPLNEDLASLVARCLLPTSVAFPAAAFAGADGVGDAAIIRRISIDGGHSDMDNNVTTTTTTTTTVTIETSPPSATPLRATIKPGEAKASLLILLVSAAAVASSADARSARFAGVVRSLVVHCLSKGAQAGGDSSFDVELARLTKTLFACALCGDPRALQGIEVPSSASASEEDAAAMPTPQLLAWADEAERRLTSELDAGFVVQSSGGGGAANDHNIVLVIGNGGGASKDETASGQAVPLPPASVVVVGSSGASPAQAWADALLRNFGVRVVRSAASSATAGSQLSNSMPLGTQVHGNGTKVASVDRPCPRLLMLRGALAAVCQSRSLRHKLVVQTRRATDDDDDADGESCVAVVSAWPRSHIVSTEALRAARARFEATEGVSINLSRASEGARRSDVVSVTVAGAYALSTMEAAYETLLRMVLGDKHAQSILFAIESEQRCWAVDASLPAFNPANFNPRRVLLTVVEDRIVFEHSTEARTVENDDDDESAEAKGERTTTVYTCRASMVVPHAGDATSSPPILIGVGESTTSKRHALVDAAINALNVSFPADRDGITALRHRTMLLNNSRAAAAMRWRQQPSIVVEADPETRLFTAKAILYTRPKTREASSSSNDAGRWATDGLTEIVVGKPNANRNRAVGVVVDDLVERVVAADSELEDLLELDTSVYAASAVSDAVDDATTTPRHVASMIAAKETTAKLTLPDLLRIAYEASTGTAQEDVSLRFDVSPVVPSAVGEDDDASSAAVVVKGTVSLVVERGEDPDEPATVLSCVHFVGDVFAAVYEAYMRGIAPKLTASVRQDFARAASRAAIGLKNGVNPLPTHDAFALIVRFLTGIDSPSSSATTTQSGSLWSTQLFVSIPTDAMAHTTPSVSSSKQQPRLIEVPGQLRSSKRASMSETVNSLVRLMHPVTGLEPVSAATNQLRHSARVRPEEGLAKYVMDATPSAADTPDSLAGPGVGGSGENPIYGVSKKAIEMMLATPTNQPGTLATAAPSSSSSPKAAPEAATPSARIAAKLASDVVALGNRDGKDDESSASAASLLGSLLRGIQQLDGLAQPPFVRVRIEHMSSRGGGAAAKAKSLHVWCDVCVPPTATGPTAGLRPPPQVLERGVRQQVAAFPVTETLWGGMRMETGAPPRSFARVPCNILPSILASAHDALQARLVDAGCVADANPVAAYLTHLQPHRKWQRQVRRHSPVFRRNFDALVGSVFGGVGVSGWAQCGQGTLNQSAVFILAAQTGLPRGVAPWLATLEVDLPPALAAFDHDDAIDAHARLLALRVTVGTALCDKKVDATRAAEIDGCCQAFPWAARCLQELAPGLDPAAHKLIKASPLLAGAMTFDGAAAAALNATTFPAWWTLPPSAFEQRAAAADAEDPSVPDIPPPPPTPSRVDPLVQGIPAAPAIGDITHTASSSFDGDGVPFPPAPAQRVSVDPSAAAGDKPRPRVVVKRATAVARSGGPASPAKSSNDDDDFW